MPIRRIFYSVYTPKFDVMIRAIKYSLLLLFAHFGVLAQDHRYEHSKTFKEMNNNHSNGTAHKSETATFGAGCYWCTEAQFQQLKGVEKVESGFSGGQVDNPTYKQVCTGTTGHAEVCNITYDPSIISFDELLAAFWTCHDPTTLNRQGNDVGTQYRSVIFYHNEPQQKLADEYLKKLDASGAFDAPIVTEISPLKEFYAGEKYHQNYVRNNPDNPYCTAVIKRKVAKFRAVFKDKLKEKGSP